MTLLLARADLAPLLTDPDSIRASFDVIRDARRGSVQESDEHQSWLAYPLGVSTEVRVHSRTPANRERFAREMTTEAIPVTAVSEARQAVEGADLVIAAGKVPVTRCCWRMCCAARPPAARPTRRCCTASSASTPGTRRCSAGPTTPPASVASVHPSPLRIS